MGGFLAVLVVSGALQLELKSSGGLTGRGAGELSIHGEQGSAKLGACTVQLTAAEVQKAAAAAVEAHPEQWAEDYASPCADCVSYQLTLGKETTRWTDASPLPQKLGQLWKVLSQVLASAARRCPKQAGLRSL